MKTQLTFADCLVNALRGNTINDVTLDISDRGVIHELVLTVGQTMIYLMPVEGKLAVEYTYQRKERSPNGVVATNSGDRVRGSQ